VFYVAPDDQLVAVPLAVRPRGEIPEPGAPVELFQARFANGGNVTTVGTKAKPQYSVTADGQFLMNVATEEPATPPITAVLNWMEELKQRVPAR
jgi:hypothetical protein